MPANKREHGSMIAMRRLLRMLNTWRARRAARRRAQLHGFMHMSDRMLADIGVRRAEVHAAISGMIPIEHIVRTRGAAPWTAQVQALRQQSRQQSEASAAHDLSVAA